MTDVQKADIIRLRSEGQSFGKIAAVLELSVNTVKSFCSRNKDSRLCYCCGTPIIQPPHTRQKKFCSNRCRMKWWYAHKDDVIIGSIAAVSAICSPDSEVSSVNFQNEMMYQATMSIARKMLRDGLISEDEYRQIDTMFIEKYQPKIGVLFVDLQPEQR